MEALGNRMNRRPGRRPEPLKQTAVLDRINWWKSSDKIQLFPFFPPVTLFHSSLSYLSSERWIKVKKKQLWLFCLKTFVEYKLIVLWYLTITDFISYEYYTYYKCLCWRASLFLILCASILMYFIWFIWLYDGLKAL